MLKNLYLRSSEALQYAGCRSRASDRLLWSSAPSLALFRACAHNQCTFPESLFHLKHFPASMLLFLHSASFKGFVTFFHDCSGESSMMRQMLIGCIDDDVNATLDHVAKSNDDIRAG